MKTLSRFVAKFTNLIVAVLSCFDRVIFKGYLPITNQPALEGFIDHILKIRRGDFMDFAKMHRVEVPDPGRETAIDAAIRTILLAAPPRWTFGDGPRRRPEGAISHHNVQADTRLGTRSTR